MAASTISNSGGPGSSAQLSPMTIKVRDKIIEQYADQSLDAINESLKRLLANEEDEQKRLGVLAARVYILRQRISGLSNTDDKAVLTAKSPTAANLHTGTVEADTEWTRLRIIKDCEVNGVRFPKSFIIDVKSADALKLVEAGNAEPVEADAPQMPAAAVAEQAAAPAYAPAAAQAEDDTDDAPAPALADLDEAPALATTPEIDLDNQLDALGSGDDDEETDFIAQLASQEIPEDDDEDSVDLADSDLALDGDITAELDAGAASEPETQASPPAEPAEEKPETVPVIEAPSAQDVTAALEALGAADDDDDSTAAFAGLEDDDSTAAFAGLEDDDETDIVASAPLDAELGDAPDSDTPDADAEDTSGADAFASATTIAADEIAALLGNVCDELGTDKPASWFEAQQSAEANDRDEPSDSETDSDDR